MVESIRQVLREHTLLSEDVRMRQRVDKILKMAAADTDLPSLAAWFRDAKVYKKWYKRITKLLDNPETKALIKRQAPNQRSTTRQRPFSYGARASRQGSYARLSCDAPD